MASFSGGDLSVSAGPVYSTNPSPAKRKSSNDHPPQAQAKRFRRDLRITDVPPEIVQYCLTFLVPADLARFASTNHHIRKIVIDSQADKPPLSPSRPSLLKVQNHEEVWFRARKNLEACSLPPIHAPCPERKMWSLLAAEVCQFCKEKPVSPRIQAPDGDQTTMGPGPDAAHIIWPFAVVSCGSCLCKEVMPFEKLSQTADAYWLHLISRIFLSDSGFAVVFGADGERSVPPPGMRPVVLNLELKSVIAKHKTALPKTTYDAMKLEKSRQMQLASLWEVWYVNSPEPPKSILQKTRRISSPLEIQNPKPRQQIRPFVSSPATNPDVPSNSDTSMLPTRKISRRALTLRSASNLGTLSRSSPRPQSSSATAGAQRRTPGPAQAASAARKHQIEERCSHLDPPISPGLLKYMDKFDAALKINLELTEEAWLALAPRLVAERPQAERRRAEQEAHQALAARKPDREMSTADIKERYETLQRPVRARLGEFVDDFTKASWADGQAINTGTARRFAAEVLANAKNRYDACRDSGKLKLDNLRWVVENKVKPLTRAFHEDLFRCPSCPQEEIRHFSLEGLLQHQTSKHGDKYRYTRGGTGKIMFHEVDWPDDPPFYVSDEFRRGRPTGRPTPQSNSNGPSGMQPPRPSTAFSQFSMSTHQYPNTSPATSPHPSSYAHPYPPPSYWTGPTSPTPSAVSYNYPGHYSQAHSPAPSWGAGWTPQENQTPFGVPPSHPVTPRPVQHQAYAYSAAPSPMATSPMPFQGGNFLQAQIETLAQISSGVYNVLSSIKQLPPSVRCFVLVHQAVSKFQGKFHNKPNLDLFTNTLRDHPLMQQLKGTTGVSCKTCSEGQSFTELRPSFYDLCTHFKSVHVEQASALRTAATHETGDNLNRADWTGDMIELPAPTHIVGLKGLPGMDEVKLCLLREAFPEIDFGDEIQPPAAHSGPVHGGHPHHQPYISSIPSGSSYATPHQYGHVQNQASDGPIFLGPVSYNYDAYQTIPAPPRPYVAPQPLTGANVNTYSGLHSPSTMQYPQSQSYSRHTGPQHSLHQEAEYSPDLPTFPLSADTQRPARNVNTGHYSTATNMTNAIGDDSIEAILGKLASKPASQGNGAQAQNGSYPAGYRL